MVPNASKTRQAGFTLIEILIAVIVLSIGLLGVATLQVTSKRGNFEAMQRAAATLYAEDLLERMRTNPTVLGSYVTSTGKTFTVGAEPPTPGTDCAAADCDADEIAAFDLDQWWDLMAGTSEGGAGGLTTPTACLSTAASAVSGTEYTVAIAWRGMDEISDVATGTASDCGRGSVGSSDYDLTAADRSFRRFISLRAYIDPFSG